MNSVIQCCNRFQCLEEQGESDFEPIGNPSLEERASRANIDLEKKSMPLMGSGKSELEPIRIDPLNCDGFGGPSRAKLDLKSPVMGSERVVGRAVGNPTGEKKIGCAVGNPIIEKNVGRR